MKILIVGSGGREHALAWSLSRSGENQVYTAPGNAGTALVGTNLPLATDDVPGLLDFVAREGVNLTIIGPEKPLIHSAIVDRFRAAGHDVYGPTAAAARLEGSKAFTDEFLARHQLSRKWFQVFDSPEPAKAYARQQGAPIVVKADGDAFGKGVKVCTTVAEAEDWIDRCLVQKEFGVAGERVVVEQCLIGPECSVQVCTDGQTMIPLAPAQDYKRVGDGDQGPNTGGMGCYSPVPALDDATLTYILERLVRPTIDKMAEEGSPVSGTLYAGCILTESGPELLEYNTRFGDPETQVVIPRLDSPLAELLQAAAQGRLAEVSPRWSEQRAVCVVVAAGGYPGEYAKGLPITGLAEAEAAGALVFHAGTRQEGEQIVTAGGRVLGVTALGDSYAAARRTVYSALEQINFEGCYYRRDIAERAERAEG
ncbi:MAG TPA: phosphoribosylamine--glycine ligase [Armatimonadota bacterium]|jgi:phosphoribosylamine--glycine ligase